VCGIIAIWCLDIMTRPGLGGVSTLI